MKEVEGVKWVELDLGELELDVVFKEEKELKELKEFWCNFNLLKSDDFE